MDQLTQVTPTLAEFAKGSKQPLNLKLSCPSCETDLWLTGELVGCRLTAARHHFQNLQVIAGVKVKEALR